MRTYPSCAQSARLTLAALILSSVLDAACCGLQVVAAEAAAMRLPTSIAVSAVPALQLSADLPELRWDCKAILVTWISTTLFSRMMHKAACCGLQVVVADAATMRLPTSGAAPAVPALQFSADMPARIPEPRWDSEAQHVLQLGGRSPARFAGTMPGAVP